MSTAPRLLMAQVDDVPGELLGEFMRRVEALGALNVQAVPTVAKKGRPGYLLYIDVPAALEHEVGVLLAAELGTWGYRVLEGQHRHFDIARIDVTLSVSVGGDTHAFQLRAKTISDAGVTLRVKAEHDDLAAIAGRLAEAGQRVPLAVLKAAVESRLHADPARTRVSVSL